MNYYLNPKSIAGKIGIIRCSMQMKWVCCLRSRNCSGKIVKLIIFLAIICYLWLLCIGSFSKRSMTSLLSAFDDSDSYLRSNSTFRNHGNINFTRRETLRPRREFNLSDIKNCFDVENCLWGQRNLCQLKHRLDDKFECNHIVYLNNHGGGRTGNQMFRVAALLGVASYHGYTPIIAPTLSLSQWFDLPNIAHVKLENKYIFTERSCCKYDDNVTDIPRDKNWTLNGYFQSWKYFKGAEHIIRSSFRVKQRYLQNAQQFINKTCSKSAQCICMHVRRGDFTLHSAQKNGYSLAPLKYMFNAMNHFKSKFDNIHFIIVTDDKRWCQSKLGSINVTVSPFSDVGSDMALMVESDHVIVTSGSFGWWGAWLSGGEVVYWRGFPGNGTWLNKQTTIDDYYPPRWIGLDT